MKPPTPPRLSALTDATLGSSHVTDEQLVTGLAVAEVFLAAASTEFVELARCQFAGGSFADSQWYRSRWVDVSLTEIDLANASFTESSLERVAFDGCRMTGLQAPVGRLQDVSFTRCTLDVANFRSAALRRVHFEDCQLVNSQWTGATFEGVAFTRCDLTEARFVNPGRISSLRFEQTTFDRTTGLTNLRGARIAGADLSALALQLADEVGLSIET